MRAGLTVVIILLAITRTNASCFGKDATWAVNGKPTVTQPSKNEPGKVMVNWGSIIKNANCIDKLYVWFWPDGTLKTGKSARKIEVQKSQTSVIVEVEACIGYRFALELVENDFSKNDRWSGDILFKTTALPKVVNLDPARITVGYYWDPVKHVSDLRRASIKIPKAMIQNSNCVDYLQVTGSAVRSRPSVSRQSSSSSMSGQVGWGHLGVTRPSSPSITVGKASTLPARTGSPARGPLANTWSSGSSSSSSSSSRTSQGQIAVGSSPFGPVETPAYANTLPRSDRTGATKAVGPVKLQPPFLGDHIELLISAPDCAEFNFEVKVFAPRKEIGKVQVNLPALANIPSYVPPPITDVMSISFTSGRPVYGVKTSSGVSAACLPAYFEASDAYRQRLENEIGYLTGKTSSAQGVISQTNDRSDDVDRETLRAHGCGCSSPTLTFSTTDAKIQKEHPDYFGSYKYKGLQDGHPFYEKAAVSPKKPMYLFFEKNQGRWLIGPTLGIDKKVEYGSEQRSGKTFKAAKCPGDPETAGKWMRKTSFLHRWEKSAALEMVCA